MPILPNQQRARLAVLALFVHLAFMLLFAATQWWQAGLSTEDLTVEAAEESNLVLAVIGGLYIISLVCAIIFFIQWFRRAYANLHRLGLSILSHTDKWAVWSWFVPFANLIRPYQIMKEIWVETQDAIPGKKEGDGLKSPAIIGWWWSCWILYNVASNIASRLGDDSDPESIAFGLHAGAISSLVGIPALFLAVQVIRQLSAFENELYEARVEIDPVDHLII